MYQFCVFFFPVLPTFEFRLWLVNFVNDNQQNHASTANSGVFAVTARTCHLVTGAKWNLCVCKCYGRDKSQARRRGMSNWNVNGIVQSCLVFLMRWSASLSLSSLLLLFFLPRFSRYKFLSVSFYGWKRCHRITTLRVYCKMEESMLCSRMPNDSRSSESRNFQSHSKSVEIDSDLCRLPLPPGRSFGFWLDWVNRFNECSNWCIVDEIDRNGRTVKHAKTIEMIYQNLAKYIAIENKANNSARNAYGNKSPLCVECDEGISTQI